MLFLKKKEKKKKKSTKKSAKGFQYMALLFNQFYRKRKKIKQVAW